MDALSKASEQGLRTGFIVNSSMGTIVGTVYPKSADVEPPPRPEKVHAVDTSLRIQDALQTLSLTGAKDGAKPPAATSSTQRRTVVDIDDCGTALARLKQPQQTLNGGMSSDRAGSTAGFGAHPGQVIRPEVQSASMLHSHDGSQILSATPAPNLLQPDFLVNTVTAMRERRKLGGQSSTPSLLPPHGSSVCVTPFQPPTAMPVGTPSFQVGSPVGTPIQVGTPIAIPVGRQAFAVASPVGATPAFPSTTPRGRRDTQDGYFRLYGETFETRPNVSASPVSTVGHQWSPADQSRGPDERGPPSSTVASRGAMGSAVSTTPRRPPGTQSMVQLQSLASVRATSPVSSSTQLRSPQHPRLVSARSTIHLQMASPTASPEHNHSGPLLDESLPGPRRPALSGGTRGTLASQPSTTRLTRNGARPQALFRSVSPPQARSPAPILQGIPVATQPSERVLLRAVSPRRQRSPSPSRRAEDVSENILNAQSRLLQTLRSTELYLAKMN